ncbi:hypothetical protein [Butyrivibrio sp. FC2001]|uniref:hypothetical protein n=1 Tax=Butyrivibrio sp. FC2001 TaxID=1280671 RepID=UPI00047BFCE8|nr:hypothetical protein [Butyrivibrio sp. FC2001]
MEYIEVFTREGKPTGKTIEKHEKKLSGEYFRHVLIIMKTKDSPAPGKGEGRYVVQQRSLRASFTGTSWIITMKRWAEELKILRPGCQLPRT